MRDIVIITAFIGMLPFVLIRPHIGVMLWGWVALLGLGSLAWGFAAGIRYNLIVAVLTALAWLLSREKVAIPFSKTLVLVLVFATITTASTFTAIGDESSAYREWEKYLKIIAFFIAIIGLINTRSRIHGLLWALLLALGFHGVKEGLRFVVSGGSHHIFGPANLIIADNNHFALAMLMALPITWYLYRTASTRIAQLGLLASFSTLFFTVVGTFSRSGFVGITAVLFWMIATGKRRFRLLLLLVPIVIAGLAIAPDRWFDRMETIETAEEDLSFSNRITAWKVSTLIALDRPMLGGGFYAVQDLETWIYYGSFVDYLDFIDSQPPGTDRARAAHSIYFQVLGDHGFLGLAVFLSILLATWVNMGKTISLARRCSGIEWVGELAVALRLSLIAYAVSGAALSMAYFDLLYAIIGLTLSLRTIAENAAVHATEELIDDSKTPSLDTAQVQATSEHSLATRRDKEL